MLSGVKKKIMIGLTVWNELFWQLIFIIFSPSNFRTVTDDCGTSNWRANTSSDLVASTTKIAKMLRQSNKIDYFWYNLWVVDPRILSLITHINTEAVSADAEAGSGQVKKPSITWMDASSLPCHGAVWRETPRKASGLLLGAGCHRRQPALKSWEFWSFRFLAKRQSACNGKTDSLKLLSRGAESCMNVRRWRQPQHHFMGTLSGVKQENSTLWIFFKHPQIIVVLGHIPKGKLNLSHNWIWYLQAFLKTRERKFISDLKKNLELKNCNCRIRCLSEFNPPLAEGWTP